MYHSVMLNNIKIYNSIYNLLDNNIFQNILYSFQLYQNINKNNLNKVKPLSNFLTNHLLLIYKTWNFFLAIWFVSCFLFRILGNKALIAMNSIFYSI